MANIYGKISKSNLKNMTRRAPRFTKKDWQRVLADHKEFNNLLEGYSSIEEKKQFLLTKDLQGNNVMHYIQGIEDKTHRDNLSKVLISHTDKDFAMTLAKQPNNSGETALNIRSKRMSRENLRESLEQNAQAVADLQSLPSSADTAARLAAMQNTANTTKNLLRSYQGTRQTASQRRAPRTTPLAPVAATAPASTQLTPQTQTRARVIQRSAEQPTPAAQETQPRSILARIGNFVSRLFRRRRGRMEIQAPLAVLNKQASDVQAELDELNEQTGKFVEQVASISKMLTETEFSEPDKMLSKPRSQKTFRRKSDNTYEI